MEFLNRYSQDFQIRLFQFTAQELKIFFDIHFWLKEEKDEKKIEETLKKFYPQHFQNNGIMKITDESVFYQSNEDNNSINNNQNNSMNNNNNNQQSQSMIEELYNLLQVFDNTDRFMNIIEQIILKINQSHKNNNNNSFNINLNQYSLNEQNAINSLLMSLGINLMNNNTYQNNSLHQQNQQFIMIANELIKDLTQQKLKEQNKNRNQQQQQQQIQSLNKQNQLDNINESQRQFLDTNLDEDLENIKDQSPIISSNYKYQMIDESELQLQQDENNLNNQQKIEQNQEEEIISEEEKEKILKSLTDLQNIFIDQPEQLIKLIHLIIFKIENIKEGDQIDIDFTQFQNSSFNNIISLLENIGVHLISSSNKIFGLFDTHQKYFIFKSYSKNIIHQLQQQIKENNKNKRINENINNHNNNNSNNEIQQMNKQPFEFENQKMLESLYLLLQSFESESQAIDQIKFIIHKIQIIDNGERIQIDLSLFGNQKRDAIIGVLETIGLIQIEHNIYQLFSDQTYIQTFVKLANDLISDLISTKPIANLNNINNNVNNNNVYNNVNNSNNNINDRAMLTKLAQQRNKQQRYEQNNNNGNEMQYTQQSSRDQMEQYRNNRRQQDLNKNRFTSQNIMTFDKLEQLEEKKYEYMNENPSQSLSSFSNNKTVTLRDIENMTIAENLQKFGKRALELTNEFRRQNNLPDLQWNNQLTYIGMKHSQDMAEGRVPFGHDGFNNRVRQITFSQRSVAENVAYCSNGYSNIPKTIVDGWINSPGHRKNMLSNSNVCGIAVYRNSKGLWYFTQLFALKV